MKYIKTFEDKNQELLNSLKELSDKMRQFKSLSQASRRESTPI
jgi:hypothetical protein